MYVYIYIRFTPQNMASQSLVPQKIKLLQHELRIWNQAALLHRTSPACVPGAKLNASLVFHPGPDFPRGLVSPVVHPLYIPIPPFSVLQYIIPCLPSGSLSNHTWLWNSVCDMTGREKDLKHSHNHRIGCGRQYSAVVFIELSKVKMLKVRKQD